MTQDVLDGATVPPGTPVTPWEAWLIDVSHRPITITLVSMAVWALVTVFAHLVLSQFRKNPYVAAEFGALRARIVSGVHALVITIMSGYALYIGGDIFWENPIDTGHPVATIVCFTFMGYCMLDTVYMMIWSADSGIMMYVHHILAMTCAVVHYFTGAQVWVGMFALAFMEVTNPNMHILLVMRATKNDSSLLFLINATIFVVNYFIFRVIGCGYMAYFFIQFLYARGQMASVAAIGAYLFTGLTMLSFYWFMIICMMARRIVLRVVFGQKSSPKDADSKKKNNNNNNNNKKASPASSKQQQQQQPLKTSGGGKKTKKTD